MQFKLPCRHSKLGVSFLKLELLVPLNDVYCSILQHFGEERIQAIINYCLRYMSELKLPCKRGHFIDFRSGEHQKGYVFKVSIKV